MAESNSAAAPALNTPIESHRFDEKKGPIEEDVPATKTKVEDDDDEDEDIDALIEDLESQDGHVEDEEEGSHPSQSVSVKLCAQLSERVARPQHQLG
jgi:H+-transporting ATPase